jgi:hypothetical protein
MATFRVGSQSAIATVHHVILSNLSELTPEEVCVRSPALWADCQDEGHEQRPKRGRIYLHIFVLMWERCKSASFI